MLDALKITLVLYVVKLGVCGKWSKFCVQYLGLCCTMHPAALVFTLYTIFSGLEMQICARGCKIMLILSGDAVCQILQLDDCHGHDLKSKSSKQILAMPW